MSSPRYLLFALLLLLGCQAEPTCPDRVGHVRRVESLAPGPAPTSVTIDAHFLHVAYLGSPCDTAYLGYALEVRTLPPQYYLSIQAASGQQQVTRRFDVSRFLPGSRFHIGGQTLVKP